MGDNALFNQKKPKYNFYFIWQNHAHFPTQSYTHKLTEKKLAADLSKLC